MYGLTSTIIGGDSHKYFCVVWKRARMGIGRLTILYLDWLRYQYHWGDVPIDKKYPIRFFDDIPNEGLFLHPHRFSLLKGLDNTVQSGIMTSVVKLSEIHPTASPRNVVKEL